MDKSDSDILDSLNYVSRGGQKLAKALSRFSVSPKGKVCIDCGASTGGFTDVLLQNGASLVYAIDVGYGQLAWTLRNDPRVKVMERTNIRYVTRDMLEETPTIAVIDVSFISLGLVLPVIRSLMTEKDGTDESAERCCEVICLIKPQFEAGKGKVGKKGVVRDPETHEEVLSSFVKHGTDSGFAVNDISYSPVKGPKGNIEYLGYLTVNEQSESTLAIQHDIKGIVAESHRQLDL